jgi:hypothetical protein
VQRIEYDDIHLAIWILGSHIDCPGSSAITAVEYSAKSRDRWKNQSAVEDPEEHPMLEVEAFCFFLIMKNGQYLHNFEDGRRTSSTGSNAIRLSMENLWNSRP